MALRHYRRALLQWPSDVLRPEISFQKAILRRIDNEIRSTAGAASEEARTYVTRNLDQARELDQANALYSCIESRYSKRVNHI